MGIFCTVVSFRSASENAGGSGSLFTSTSCSSETGNRDHHCSHPPLVCLKQGPSLFTFTSCSSETGTITVHIHLLFVWNRDHHCSHSPLVHLKQGLSLFTSTSCLSETGTIIVHIHLLFIWNRDYHSIRLYPWKQCYHSVWAKRLSLPPVHNLLSTNSNIILCPYSVNWMNDYNYHQHLILNTTAHSPFIHTL